MPPDRGKNIGPGMEVRVEPTTVKREEYGAIVGTLVADLGISRDAQGMLADLHKRCHWSRRFSQDARPMRPRLFWSAILQTVQRLSLDLGKGPPIRLSSGTLARAEVTTREAGANVDWVTNGIAAIGHACPMRLTSPFLEDAARILDARHCPSCRMRRRWDHQIDGACSRVVTSGRRSEYAGEPDRRPFAEVQR